MNNETEVMIAADIYAGVVGAGDQYRITYLKHGGCYVPHDLAEWANAPARGWSYCGFLSLRDGHMDITVAQDNPDAAFTLIFAGAEFTRQNAEYLAEQHARIDDFVRFAENLFRLPDPR